MKKIVSALLILMCFMCLFACTDDKTTENETTLTFDTQDVDLVAIKDSIIEDCGIEGAMDMDTDMLLNVYGIEKADVLESACFVTFEAVFPDEIVMVRAKDEAAVERIEEKLGNKLESVLMQSKNYDAENYAIAQKCKVITKGDLVVMFISAQHEKMQEIFNAAF